MMALQVFRGSFIDCGFFVRPSYRPREETDNDGDRICPLEGMPQRIQFFRATLTGAAIQGSQQHLVLSAHYPPIKEKRLKEIRTTLRTHFPDTTLSFIVDKHIGWVKASTDEPNASVAAAVAFIRLVAGWDDTEPMIIMFEQVTFAANFEHCDGSWWVKVTESSTTP